MGEITAVVSAKGGTGVTTVTAGIGSALARRGQKTLLLDLNFMKGDLPVLFGAEQRIAWHLLDCQRRPGCKHLQLYHRSVHTFYRNSWSRLEHA